MEQTRLDLLERLQSLPSTVEMHRQLGSSNFGSQSLPTIRTARPKEDDTPHREEMTRLPALASICPPPLHVPQHLSPQKRFTMERRHHDEGANEFLHSQAEREEWCEAKLALVETQRQRAHATRLKDVGTMAKHKNERNAEVAIVREEHIRLRKAKRIRRTLMAKMVRQREHCRAQLESEAATAQSTNNLGT
jgi:hypothetical protein